MTLRLSLFIIAVLSIGAFAMMSFGQVDTLVGQMSNSPSESFAGDISGDGRFIVFESTGNLATENPRNEDGNTEIFLFDYAQRRTFQITDTRSVLFDPNRSGPATFDNVRITIVNTRPRISNDGKWITFSSNATTSRPGTPDATNPGSFNGNAFTSPTPTPTASPTPSPTPTASPSPTATPTPAANPLSSDANLEIWMYQLPAFTPVANLSTGEEIAFTQLAGGAFIRVTNTDPSQLPRPATTTSGAFIAEDNHDPSISDDGSVIAFVSTRDLVPAVGNAFPTEDNDEIFTFNRTTSQLNQVTKTPRGVVSNPIYSKNPTISGNGLRVAFSSTGENPIVGMTGGNNPVASRNEEIFFSDLDAAGAPTGTRRQVTVTTPTNPGDPVNILDYGRRMSRDGRYIGFDSYADLAGENNNTNQTGFALFVYDTLNNTFRRIGPRSTADEGAGGGDVAHYPSFTDYGTGTAQTLVFESRLNLKADGTVAGANAADGLNPGAVRPVQLYSYSLSAAPATATFTRLTKFPDPNSFVASTQPLTSNTLARTAFNLALTELGTGNPDQSSEVYYLLVPSLTAQGTATFEVKTGASGRPVTAATPPPATPTPSPTPTGSPTPSPSPSPTPSATPTPSASPTPTTTGPALGIGPGSLVIVDLTGNSGPVFTARAAVGSLDRRPTLPIELSGVSISVNGAAAGIRSVSPGRIEFVAPPALLSSVTGTSYPVTIFNNGTTVKGFINIVPTQPDIFNIAMTPTPGGRARLVNATNTIFTTEPFVIRTIQRSTNRLVASRLRVYLTGVEGAPAASISIRIGTVNISPPTTGAFLVEPGVYAIDFDLPSTLERAGDQPVVVSVTVNGVTFHSRFNDTAPRTSIL